MLLYKMPETTICCIRHKPAPFTRRTEPAKKIPLPNVSDSCSNSIRSSPRMASHIVARTNKNSNKTSLQNGMRLEGMAKARTAILTPPAKHQRRKPEKPQNSSRWLRNLRRNIHTNHRCAGVDQVAIIIVQPLPCRITGRYICPHGRCLNALLLGGIPNRRRACPSAGIGQAGKKECIGRGRIQKQTACKTPCAYTAIRACNGCKPDHAGLACHCSIAAQNDQIVQSRIAEGNGKRI